MHRPSTYSCQVGKIEYMRPLITMVFVLTVLAACTKNQNRIPEEQQLYGKWEMGPGNGDTIEFLNSGGRNILRFYDDRFITGIYTEREYRYVDGQLSIQMYPSQVFTTITSFNWNQGKGSFSVLSNEWYPMLSASVTLVYNKVP